MSEIKWTKCSERMPPDDDTKIIAKNESEDDYVFTTGLRLKVYLASCGDTWNRVKISFQTYWTPYTREVWKEQPAQNWPVKTLHAGVLNHTTQPIQTFATQNFCLK